MTAPFFSIVTTCHNDGRYLVDAYRSLWQQQGSQVEYEAMIWDNGSTDGTPYVGAALAEADSRVRLFGGSRVKSQPEALNAAIRETRGEWIVWLNADDRLAPWALHVIAHTAKHSLAVNCIVSPLQFFGANTDLYPIARYNPATMIDEHQIPGVRAVRRDLWERVGGEDEAITVGADWDWAVRASTRGLVPYQHPTPLWHCRKFPAHEKRLSDRGDLAALKRHMRKHV